MTQTTTTTPAQTTQLDEQIASAIQVCADYGIELCATQPAELLSNIDDPDVATQALHELARLIELRSGVVHYIHYIEDRVFHDAVSKTATAILSTVGDDLPSKDADRLVTESLLAAGVWPTSWEALMDEEQRAKLIDTILAERKATA